MSEIKVVCAHCGLRYPARAGGKCPRCHPPETKGPEGVRGLSALAIPALARPARTNARRTSETVEDGTPLRWAGAVLLAGVVLSLVEMGVLRAHFLIDGEQLWGRFAVVALDTALGAVLLLGHAQFRRWAMIRAVVGGAILVLMNLIEGQTFLAGTQLLSSAILVTLLSETPLRERVRLALGAALGLFLLQGVGIYLMVHHKLGAFAAERDVRRLEALQRFNP